MFIRGHLRVSSHVKGEMVGVHESKMAAVKAVERERGKLKEEGVDYVASGDGLEVKALREDDKREVVVQAVKWNVMI